MIWQFVTLAIVVTLATYASALALALIMVSPSALEEELRESGRESLATWAVERANAAGLAVALVRTILRMAVFALVLVETVGLGKGVDLTLSGLLIAGVIAVLIVWTFTSVLASAIARYATIGLVAGAMPFLPLLTIICFPLTRGLGFIDEAVRRLSGANLRERDDAAEAELLRSIGDTHREGGLDERSAALLENIVEFSSTDVAEVMTPRTDIDGIELNDDLAVIRAFIVKVGHSRIPVYEEARHSKTPFGRLLTTVRVPRKAAL